jgi:superfamily II DNA or RNA helicase
MGTTVTIVNNTRALLETDHELVRDVVDDALSITIPNAWRSPQYRSGLWDGKKHLLTPSGSFPLGLLPTVEEALTAQKTAYDVKDDRDEMLRFRVHTVPDQLLQASPADAKRGAWQDASGTWWLKLELHQKQAIAAALNEGSGIIFSATGTGKTEVACGIAALSKRLTKDRVSILFFTHRRKLARDTRKRFATRLGMPLEDIGLIAHGKWEEGRSGVYVALLDTLKQPKYAKQRKQLFKDVDILIIDECHHASATTWYQLIQKCDAPLRLGLSGTPLHRSDQKDAMLIGATGRVIFQMDMKQAQAAGVITPVEITTVPVRDTTVPMSFKDEWRDIYVKGVVDNFAFHETVAENVEKDVASKRTTLVLVQEIKHAENLLTVFDDWGIRAELVHGQLHETEQDDVVSKFGKGVFPVLIATTFLGEGVDIPAVDSVHLCNSEKAVIPVIQKIGRGVRKGVTGKVCRVTDYLHMTHKTLAKHSLERLKIYKEWGLLGEE